jgi:hypothetical protein
MTTLKNIPSLIGGAAVLAAATIGLTAAIAGAEKSWDIGAYDSCMSKAEKRWLGGVTNEAQFNEEAKWCCVSSGGELSATQGCTTPAELTQVPPPPLPSRIGTAPLPTEATDAPVSPAPGSNAPGGVSPGKASR